MTGKQALRLLKSAGSQWNDHNGSRLGAALAYYTLLSLAPLLVLLVAVFGLVLSKTTAESDLIADVREVAGYSEAQTLKTFLNSAHHASSGIVATLMALTTLLFGASGVFVELRDSLNTIWNAPVRSSSSWRDMIAQRLIAFVMILALGALLLASILLSAAGSIIEKFFAGAVPFHAAVFSEIGNHAISLAALTTLFALIFKFVPSTRIRWRDAAIGAGMTAILFETGKALLALYIATAGVGSAYGAAGSVIALVVWVYYSAQIFFFGAAFTRVYAEDRRSGERTGAPRA